MPCGSGRDGACTANTNSSDDYTHHRVGLSSMALWLRVFRLQSLQTRPALFNAAVQHSRKRAAQHQCFTIDAFQCSPIEHVTKQIVLFKIILVSSECANAMNCEQPVVFKYMLSKRYYFTNARRKIVFCKIRSLCKQKHYRACGSFRQRSHDQEKTKS